MRIAVTGTHGSGKTTLQEDFVDQHQAYEVVQEPYWELAQQGVMFAQQPSIDDFMEQLNHNLQSILSAEHEQDIIFDRCPLDFIAYLEVLSEREGAQWEPSGQLLVRIEKALAALDLIIFLPLSTPDEITAQIEEVELRHQTDERLKQIIRDDTLGMLELLPRLVELSGSRNQRTAALSKLIL
ncbi:hypothetical protein PsAD2_03814 [Pseudovibrio axinellae]|uniref:NadR/Ttd14 AAA domain-containing protein n=1 Tax=Pseudovibrio axinellae TaxID=989403 RepID=A0A165ULE6_9HYPH|nr:AAA family ATPase [Pseudovibrio axinellae]KZL12509.1 hypothetical protein PsAD2_03814 [Pseudovibrio axinellae]SEP69160.1 AAA domain-containing protein [Pseudovibrio axinellae]